MKRGGGKKRQRLAVAATVVSFVGIGLAAPFIISGTSTDLSFHSAAVIAATRDSFTLTSPVTLSGFSDFRLERGVISLAPSGPGDLMTGASALAMLASGKAKLKVDNASMSLDLGRGGFVGADGVASGSYAPVLAALVDMSFAELAIRDSEIDVRRADGSVEKLTSVTATITRQRGGKIKASGRFDYRGRTVDAAINLDMKGSGDGAPPHAVPLSLVIKNELVEARADGALSIADTPQFSASDAQISLTSIRDIAAWLGADWGNGRGLGKLDVKGGLEWTPRGIAFPVARVSIDGNEAEGTIAIKLARQRAAIDGTLDFETIDISPYLDTAAQAKSPAAFDLAYILPRHLTGRSQFPILQDIDADLRISAGKVSAQGMVFGRGAASLSLKSGVMLADLAELEIGKGGRCVGQLSVNATTETGAYHLKSKIMGVDVAMLGSALWSRSPVSGIGDVLVDVTANGNEKSSLIESATGKVSVIVPASGQL
ncbi:MAG: AsmA family protein, partial [Hyphomicrobiaceae bacterium]